MKIYTKTGDKGETSLFGGKRVSKDDLRIECNGLIDELNSILGVAVNEIKNSEIVAVLHKIQNQLFDLAADIATPIKQENKNLKIKRIDKEYYEFLEKEIDFFDSQLPELKNFILPGGSKGASSLHLARTFCRRAERKVVTLKKSVDIGNDIIIYLNRLSDLFFVLARYENKFNKIPDVIWKSSS
jgi:cob(I)alamin adenosyltransferase